ncbi:MAG: hypothetical protein NC048_09970 [Bacteroides sp.]|nr:hypothetical protein [Bacteroides sp.]
MLRALSTTYTERVNGWMDSAFDSRLEKGAPVIYCGTRWTDGDMIARAMDRGLDKQLSIPALTAEGVSFCEDVKTTREYLDIRKSLRLDEDTDGYTWLAEYMQQPLRVEGYLYPREGLHYYEEIPDEARLLERVCFVDPADEGADGFTAVWCDIRSMDGYPAVYVVDTFNTSGEGVEAGSARVADRCRRHGTEACMVEVNGVGRAAYLLLRSQAGDTRVKGYQEHTAKDVRILSTFEHVRRAFWFRRPSVTQPMQYRFHDYLTHTPAKRLSEYRHRLDPADCLAQASMYVKNRYKDAA